MNDIGVTDNALKVWWESVHDPYERLWAIGKYLIKDNPDATFYDLFNFVREEILGGWKIDEQSNFIKSLDYDIDYDLRQS